MIPTVKEHIETLENILRHPAYLDTADAKALRTAIELMRAAAPKDNVAEKALCKRAAEDISGWPDLEADIEEVFELRAQARAEGYTKALDELLPQWEADVRTHQDDIRAKATLTAELSAAQAEIERLQNQIADLAEHDSAGARAYDKLETKHSAAQAEIERQKNELHLLRESEEIWHDKAKRAVEVAQQAQSNNAPLCLENGHLKVDIRTANEACEVLETKLTNLRTAAERFINSEIGFESMNAAIEASRS